MEFDAPTSDELKELVSTLKRAVDQRDAQLTELHEQLTAREARIAELEARLADLEERLGRNPRNSSMPPSKEPSALLTNCAPSEMNHE